MRKRFYGIDYVKAYAIFSVVAVHFRHNLQKKIPMEIFTPKVSLFMSAVYELFINCVPLFIICTGYLMLNKKGNKKYYLGFFKVYSVYLLCCLLTIYLMGKFNNMEYGAVREIVFKILNFKIVTYAWYVNMYLTLYFLIPILNLIVEKFSRKELKQSLVVLSLVIGLSSLVNSNPSINEQFKLPDYWNAFYPVTYYLMGAYFRKYLDIERIERKQKVCLFLIYILATLIGMGINMYNAAPTVGAREGGYASILIVIQSSSLFLLMMSSFKRNNFIVSKVAKLTLPIYLMSFFVDRTVYPKLIELFGNPVYLIKYMPIIVLSIFFLAFVLALVIDVINKLLWWGIGLFKFKSKA